MPNKDDFLNDIYKIRIQFYSDYTSRMWTRFNILLTAEIGLLGFFAVRWYEELWQDKLWLFPAVGIFLSLVWYILGVQDRYFFEGFRKQIQYLENKISSKLKINDIEHFSFGNPIIEKQDLFTRRLKFLSLSRLAAAFPIFFFVTWLIVLFFSISAN